MQAARAPDGNGGVYAALQRSEALNNMRQHGVLYVDCYSVDNAAARIADPTFIGACVASGAELGARVVAKATPGERVGVFARCVNLVSLCFSRTFSYAKEGCNFGSPTHGTVALRLSQACIALCGACLSIIHWCLYLHVASCACFCWCNKQRNSSGEAAISRS